MAEFYTESLTQSPSSTDVDAAIARADAEVVTRGSGVVVYGTKWAVSGRETIWVFARVYATDLGDI